METKFDNIFKTKNVKTSTKTIFKRTYKVPQDTRKRKSFKLPYFYLQAIKFLAIFNVQIVVTLLSF